MLNRILHYVFDVWRPPVSRIGQEEEEIHHNMRSAEGMNAQLRILVVYLRFINV